VTNLSAQKEPKPWWLQTISNYATLAVFGFIDGGALWLVQHFALHLGLSYWQCYWVAVGLLFTVGGARKWERAT
jgi:hypothetical protein